jgi:hypothetical protein
MLEKIQEQKFKDGTGQRCQSVAGSQRLPGGKVIQMKILFLLEGFGACQIH